MINLTNTSKKERAYLIEMCNASNEFSRPVDEVTLRALKTGALEAALNALNPKLKPRQVKVLTRIIGRIPKIGEVKECKVKSKPIKLIEDVVPNE